MTTFYAPKTFTAEDSTAVYDTVSAIMAFESGTLDNDGVQELFQTLIDTGMAWRLQGRIGRTAMDLIANGICSPHGGVNA